MGCREKENNSVVGKRHYLIVTGNIPVSYCLFTGNNTLPVNLEQYKMWHYKFDFSICSMRYELCVRVHI